MAFSKAIRQAVYEKYNGRCAYCGREWTERKMIDKFKTCKDCPDRTVGCHITCEGYLERAKHNKELAEHRRKEAVMKEYEFEKNAKIRIKATKDFQRSRNRGR